MTRRHAEHPEASAELEAAAAWYEEQQPGLGHELFRAVAQTIAAIDRWPDAAPEDQSSAGQPVQLRSRHLLRFPYRIIYLVHEDELVIVAYAHDRREPGYWDRRMGQ